MPAFCISLPPNIHFLLVPSFRNVRGFLGPCGVGWSVGSRCGVDGEGGQAENGLMVKITALFGLAKPM